MASKGYRSAGILIEIQGEKEYTARIKTIREETKALEKELKLVEAQFAGERNTLEALSKEYKANADILKNLGKEHKELIARGQRIQKQLDDETKAHNRLSYVLEYERKILEVYGRVYGENSQKYKDQKRAVEEAQVAYDRSTSKIDDLNRAYSKNTSEIKENEIKAAGLQSRNKQVKAGLDDMEKSGKNTTNMFDKMGKTLGATAEETERLREQLQFHQLVQYAREGGQIIIDMFQKIADKVQETIQSYYDFEKAVISVSKTVPNLSDEDAAAMISSLSGALPLTREEIAQILSQGGQYGISREGLEAYGKAMAALASATNIGVGDLSMVAQLASILGAADDDYMKMASTLTDLGNKTRTTEKDTVHMAQTMASTANIIGLTQAETLALANSLSAYGGMARGAGTAMNRFLSSLHEAVLRGGDDLDAFAQVAGMTGEQFRTVFERDAMDAILAVLKGMNQVVESGGDIYSTFDKLDINNSIDKQNLKNLAVGYDELVRTLDIANTAWDENTALMTEFNKAVETNTSQVTLYENALDDLKATLGELNNESIGIPKLRTVFTELINEINDDLKNPNGIRSKIASFIEDIKIPFQDFAETMFGEDTPFGKVFGKNSPFGKIAGSLNPFSSITKFIDDWIADLVRKANLRKYDFSGSEDYYSQMARDFIGTANSAFQKVLNGASSPVSMMPLEEMWGEAFTKGFDNITTTMGGMTSEAQVSAEKIKESLTSIYDSMDKFSAKSQINLKDWIKNLKDNAKAMADYSANLEIVMNDDRINESVKEFIRTHGMEETYNIVGDLAKGGNDKLVEELNKAFDGWSQQIDDSTEQVVTSFDGLFGEAKTAMEESDLPGKTNEFALDVIEGFTSGIDDNLDAIHTSVSGMADAIVTTFTDSMQINSPSKVMHGLGEYAVEGLIEGMESKEGEAILAAQRLAEKAALSYNLTMGRLIGQINATYTVTGKDYTNVLNQISRNTGRQHTVVVNNSGGRSSQSAVNDLERALVRGMLY